MPKPVEMMLYRRLAKQHVFIAILDRCAGKRACFTVYKIKLDGDKAAEVIGRELDLRTIRKLVHGLVQEGA